MTKSEMTIEEEPKEVQELRAIVASGHVAGGFRFRIYPSGVPEEEREPWTQVAPSGWYNYKTGKTEWLSKAPPDDRLNEFISQSPEAQGLYAVYRHQGYTESESAIMVLNAQIEARTDEPVPHKEHKHEDQK